MSRLRGLKFPRARLIIAIGTSNALVSQISVFYAESPCRVTLARQWTGPCAGLEGVATRSLRSVWLLLKPYYT